MTKKTKAPKKEANPAPPKSYRLGAEREGRFNAFQKSMDLSWSEAMHRLVDAGLRSFGFGADPEDRPEKPKRTWDVL